MDRLWCLNPRFDGAFLIRGLTRMFVMSCRLNPRFDGAFLIHTSRQRGLMHPRLNPRFDGAFLILEFFGNKTNDNLVLIPDLMGLF